jgi:hypothetical protein
VYGGRVLSCFIYLFCKRRWKNSFRGGLARVRVDRKLSVGCEDIDSVGPVWS